MKIKTPLTDSAMNSPVTARSKPNSLLSVLHFHSNRGAEGAEVVRCREFPGITVQGTKDQLGEMFEAARNYAAGLLEKGVQPVFRGTGTCVFEGWYLPQNTDKHAHLSIPDSWCMMKDEELGDHSKRAASEWVKKVGRRITIKRCDHKVTVTLLSDLIAQAVKRARKKFKREKAEWQTRWEQAQAKRAEELNQEEQLQQMITALVKEALRYVVKGGRLRVPWALRGKQATAAGTWHLMSPEEFNRRAVPPKLVRHEEKDAEGNVIRWTQHTENDGGGEMMAAGEQAEYMIACFAKHAEEGNEEALRWLHRLGLKAIDNLWMAIEQQPELAKRVSTEWNYVPVATNGSELSFKEARVRLRQLAMPRPPKRDLRIDPESEHHRDIARVERAIHFLFDTPPATTPWTGVDESAPDWLRDAWIVLTNNEAKAADVAEVYWRVFEAAMTDGETAPWKKDSRPRKAKEKFIEAVIARLPKPLKQQTP